MNIQKFLNIHMTLNESGIRIPKGTRAAKILAHDDLDGVASAKILHDQLVRQGINSNNIIVRKIEDGTTKEAEEKLFQKQKGQMIIVTDFDRFKNKDLAKKNIDFHTDHHQTKEKFSKGGGATGATEFKSDTEHLDVKHSTAPSPAFSKMISHVDSADFGDDFENVILKKIDPKSKTGSRLRRLAIITNTLVNQLVRRPGNAEATELLVKQSKQSIPSFYQKAREMANLNNLQVLAIKELKKGTTKKTAGQKPNMNMIDKIRSIVKNKGSQKMANAIQASNPQILAHIKMPERLAKTDVGDIEKIQKKLESGEALRKTDPRGWQTEEPKKPLKKDFESLKGYEEALEKFQEIEKPKKPLKKDFKGDSEGYEEAIKKFQEIEKPKKPLKKDYREFDTEGHEKAKQEHGFKEQDYKKFKEKDQITQSGNIIIQNIIGKDQPGRYTNFFVKTSTPIDAQMREWATFLQLSLNPKATQQIREKVDLGKAMREAIKEVRDEMGTKYEDWAFDIIQSESGGHKGITNVSGLGTLGIMPKKLRERLKELKASDKYKRLKALPAARQKELKKLPGFQAIEKEIKELETARSEKAGRRKEIIAEIKKKMLEKANAAIAKAKSEIKESYINEIKYLAEDI